jgi:hypothetical protein
MPAYTNHPSLPLDWEGTPFAMNGNIPAQIEVSLEEFSFGPFTLTTQSASHTIYAEYDTARCEVIGFREYRYDRAQRMPYEMPVGFANIIQLWLNTGDGLTAIQNAITLEQSEQAILADMLSEAL